MFKLLLMPGKISCNANNLWNGFPLWCRSWVRLPCQTAFTLKQKGSKVIGSHLKTQNQYFKAVVLGRQQASSSWLGTLQLEQAAGWKSFAGLLGLVPNCWQVGGEQLSNEEERGSCHVAHWHSWLLGTAHNIWTRSNCTWSVDGQVNDIWHPPSPIHYTCQPQVKFKPIVWLNWLLAGLHAF